MNIKNIDFSALSPFGVEVNGIEITEIGDRDLINIKHTIADNGLVVFRKQAVNDADFVAFLSRLGPMTFTEGETPVLHQPDLNVVSNIGRDRPPKSVFHTDTSYVAKPPAFTALRALTIPASGGDTLFSDQYHAYDTLPRTVQEQFADAQVLHIVTGVVLDEHQESWHPLFLRHPLSGRLALFLSTPKRCQSISGMTSDKAQQIIRLLYQHSIRHYRLYRHRWQPGDIVIWDNRCTMHRADHSQITGDRLLHRGMVLGEPIVKYVARSVSGRIGE